MAKTIVVVGSVNLDLVCRGKRIPAPGETVKGDLFQTFHGGKGANQAVAVARLGYPVSMIGKVGDDDFGSRLRKGLRSAGVNDRHVGIAKGTASGVALISVDAKGQNSIVVVPGANAMLMPADVEGALPLLRSAAMVLTQLEIPMETVECLCEFAHRYQIPLMLDPAPARPLTGKILNRVTYLTPNETETCTISGMTGAKLDLSAVAESARVLHAKGASNVVIKLGARGAYVSFAGENGRLIRSFKVPVVDSTAAGDAFNAGLAVALLRGMRPAEAVRYATAVGAVSVTRAGAQPAMPTAAEVDDLMTNQKSKAAKPAHVATSHRNPTR